MEVQISRACLSRVMITSGKCGTDGRIYSLADERTPPIDYAWDWRHGLRLAASFMRGTGAGKMGERNAEESLKRMSIVCLLAFLSVWWSSLARYVGRLDCWHTAWVIGLVVTGEGGSKRKKRRR